MIKIDVDTRCWEIPNEEVFLGVESDGNVKKYKFELSKNEFYEGLNFTDCNCYINYKNEDNDAIPYGITDMAVQGDGKVTFTWEVSRGATIFKGNTYAVLCAKKVREDGTITNEWNSRIGAFIVNKGIEPKDSIAELPEIDIISQLLNTARYVNQIAQQNISKSEENISKSEELIQTAQELLEQNDFYKGYIVDGETYSGKASNSGIKLHKVVGKTEQGTTKGYQLFDASKLASKTQGGATVTNNDDGSFTISGSGKLTSGYQTAFSLDTETSRKLVREGTITLNAGTTLPYMYVSFVNNSGSLKELNTFGEPTSTTTLTQEEINSDGFYINIGFWGAKNYTIKPGIVRPMLYQDGDGTWEQYTGGKPAPNGNYPMEIKNVEISKITSHGRQLFDASKLPTKSLGGATVTNNGDGSFTISGSGKLTSGYQTAFSLDTETSRKLVREGTITLNAGTTLPYMYVSFVNNSGSLKELNTFGEPTSTTTLTQEEINSDGFYINIGFWGAKNYTIKPGIVRPMLYQDGDGTWEPFKHATVETSIILADGEVYEEGQPILRRRKKVLFDGSSDEDWTLNPSWTGNSEKYDYFYTRINDIKSNLPFFIANRFKCITDENISIGYEGEAVYKDSIVTKDVYFSILKSRLSSNDEDGFKKWVQSHPIEFEYELETPTIEELKVPTIPSYYPNTNIWTDNELPTDMQWKLLADSDRSLEVEANEKRIAALEKQLIGG